MQKRLIVKTTVAGSLLAVGLILVLASPSASARPLYYSTWQKDYAEVAKANNVTKEVKCNVCHIGTDRKKRNAYGKAIQDALEGKTNVKDKMAVHEALKKAEEAKSGTEGKTFGDLLKANELPAKGE